MELMITNATRVHAIIGLELAVSAEAITPDTRLADLGADSLDRINLMMACEEEFGIAIDDPEAEACKTVADVVALVVRKIAAKSMTAA